MKVFVRLYIMGIMHNEDIFVDMGTSGSSSKKLEAHGTRRDLIPTILDH